MRPNDKVLRAVAADAPEHVDDLVKDLFDTCLVHGGAGLSAPQVGVSLRVAVVACGGQKIALVNPRVVRVGNEFSLEEEGCLTIPGVTVWVLRSTRVTVVSRGKTYNLSGIAARCAQHEIDHLDGILITDRDGRR